MFIAVFVDRNRKHEVAILEMLFKGLNEKPGYFQFLDWWLVVHILVGVGVASTAEVELHKAAQTFLLPLAGILVGLSFAWVGNAQALLQESEIEKIAEYHPDGIQTYVYTFQLAILTILVTLVAWGLAALEVFERAALKGNFTQYTIEVILYFLASLTLRECWHVVMGSQLLILSRHKVRQSTSA